MKIISARIVDPGEQKSVAQVEEELLKKHEEELNIDNNTPGIIDEESNQVAIDDDLSDEKVLKYLEKRYNKEISSFDELMAERKSSEDLPEDVAAFLKYKKETGRGIDDFMRLNKDYDKIDEQQLVREYLMATNDGLDDDDIDVMMDDYMYDEDLDDESKIKKIKIERKKKINEARKYFSAQKDKYKVPLESRPASMSPEEKEEFDAYRQYTKQAKTADEEASRKRQWFSQKTDELFSGEFKGFEFNIDDKKITFNPGNAADIKKVQSNPQNFISKFLDESGLLKDAVGYHRSLAVAMNPEKFAKFFYEQGKSEAMNDVTKKIKNVNMSERKAPEFGKQNSGEVRVRDITPDHGRGLKIRSNRNII